MDEAEKYQQRLQAIAEKRKAQEEEERLRREVEEEWLKLAQRKRKSLRDQWLMDVPNAPATDGPGPRAPLWPPTQRAEGQAKEGTEEVEHMAQEEEEAVMPVQDGRQTNSTENNTRAPCQIHTDTKEKESRGEEEATVAPPSTSLPIQNGGEDRSVLGMLEVRVERDLRTGATVIKSVAPLPPGVLHEATAMATVFDDGRKSIRAVSGSPAGTAEPSADELGQVLNTLADVGVPVLLEARGLVPPSGEGQGGQEEAREAEAEATEVDTEADETSEVESTGGAPEGSDHAAASVRTHKTSQELEPEEDDVHSIGDADNMYEIGRDEGEDVIVTEGEEKEGEEEDEEEEAFRPEEGLDPITLTFLGFSQAATEPGQGNQDDGLLVSVERVIIREDSNEEEEERWEEEYPQDHEMASPETEICLVSTRPLLGTQMRQPGAEGLAEMADPGLELYLAKQTDWIQARQGGGATEEERHRGTETEATEPARAATSEHDPDRGSPEVPVHLLVLPTLGTRTEGPDVEGEMGGGEGAVEKESLDDVFQDVSLDEPQLSAAQEPESQPPALAAELSRAEGAASPKRKTCQCCSIM